MPVTLNWNKSAALLKKTQRGRDPGCVPNSGSHQTKIIKSTKSTVYVILEFISIDIGLANYEKAKTVLT